MARLKAKFNEDWVTAKSRDQFECVLGKSRRGTYFVGSRFKNPAKPVISIACWHYRAQTTPALLVHQFVCLNFGLIGSSVVSFGLMLQYPASILVGPDEDDVAINMKKRKMSDNGGSEGNHDDEEEEEKHPLLGAKHERLVESDCIAATSCLLSFFSDLLDTCILLFFSKYTVFTHALCTVIFSSASVSGI